MAKPTSFDHNDKSRENEWDRYDKELRQIAESKALDLVSKAKVHEAFEGLGNGDPISKWLFAPNKSAQVKEQSYPKVIGTASLPRPEDVVTVRGSIKSLNTQSRELQNGTIGRVKEIDSDGDANISFAGILTTQWVSRVDFGKLEIYNPGSGLLSGSEAKINTARTIYFNQLQSELYQWLLASFGENEKELLEKYNLHSERDGDKPVAEADKGVDFGIDNRWPYATYAYAEIRQKYGQRKSLNVFQLMQEYDLALSGFNGSNLDEYATKLLNKKFELDKAKRGKDPEFLEGMKVLLKLWAKPGWTVWAEQYATQDSPKTGAFTVQGVLEAARLQGDMKSAGSKSEKLSAHIAAAEAGAHFGKGSDTSAGEGTCVDCNKLFEKREATHTRCDKCQSNWLKLKWAPKLSNQRDRKSANKDQKQQNHERAVKLAGHQAADSMEKKGDAKRKRDHAMRRKPSARKAAVHDSSQDSDDSDSDSEASARAASARLADQKVKERKAREKLRAMSAQTTALINSALGCGAQAAKYKKFKDSDDEDDEDDRHSAPKKSKSSAGMHSAHGLSLGGSASAFAGSAKSSKGSKQTSAGAYKAKANNIYFIVTPPKELRQAIPEYFMLVDSGATHHMVALVMWIAYLTGSNVKVVWGDASHSRALGIGLLVGLTYAFLKDSRKAQQILFTSGQSDTLLVPDASRDLASTNRWTAQGHTPHLQETNPGLIGFNNSFFIPFCYERDTGYYLLPRFPPPTQAVFQAQGNTSMPVIDLHKNIKDGTYKNIYMGHMVNAVDSILERGELAGAADAKDVEFIPPKVAQPYMHAGVPLLWSDRQAKGGGYDAAAGKSDEGDSSKLANEYEGDASDTESECSEDDSSSDEDVAAQKEDAQIGGKSKRKADKEPEHTRKEKRLKSTNAGTESSKRDNVQKAIQKEKRSVNLFKTNKQEKLSLRQSLQKAHERYGHIAPKRLVDFKKKGKLYSSLIPSKGRLDFKAKDCPICLAMKYKKPPKPEAVEVENKQELGLWEKVLVSDKAGEILSKVMKTTVTAKQVKMVTVAKDEHFTNGGPEKAIQDIDNMVKCCMADRNLPKDCWDIVGEHATLVNACTSSCPTNPEITIYEAETGEIPNLDCIPELGCFAVRHLGKLDRKDFKLSPKNQAGVFVGIATLQGTYGSVLLVGDRKYVVAREHVNYVQDHFPLQREKSANKELDWLNRLLGRNNGNDIVGTEMERSQEPAALDPMQLEEDDGVIVDTDSDGFESDDEVKSVISELDSSVRQLAGYEPIHVTSGAVRETDRHGDGQASQESYAGDTVDSANADDSAMDDRSDSGPPPRRSKRWQGRAGGRDNINSAEFSVTPNSQDPVDTAKTIDEITEKDLRANKTLLIGRKIKRFFPGFGGSWGMVEGYDVAKDVYKLRYGIDGYTEKLAFEDVLKLLPKSWFRRQHEANVAEVQHQLARAAHARCFLADHKPKPAHRPPEFSQPNDYRSIATAPDKEHWVTAMDKEFFTLEKMGCWEVIDVEELPPGCVPIGCKWVYKLKFRAGEYERHKARLVALGYQQVRGRDFFESFSPTCNHVSIRLILALTAMPGWKALDLDAESAFVSSELPKDEEVYMKLPAGYEEHLGGKTKILKLRRSLYGLHQSPLNYYNLVKEVYEKAGLRQLQSDECVFVRYENNIKGGPKSVTNEDMLKQGYFQTMETVPMEKRIYKSCPHPVAALIIAVYVDNNPCRFNCIDLLEDFEKFLKKDGRIKMQREGKLEWLLGIRYHFDEVTGAVSCDQKPSIVALLAKYGMTDCNTTKIPLSPSSDLESLPIPDKPDEVVVKLYASLVGELLYIAINTVPQISYIMSCLTRYMTRATEAHFTYAKGTLRYLKGVMDRKITWCAANARDPHVRHEIWAGADSSFADIKPSRKSTFCYQLFVNNAIFSWKSSLSSIVATSVCEAELMAFTSCACEVVYARKLAGELGFTQLGPTKIYEDNEGAIVLAKKMHLRNRSKHIGLRFCFVQHLIAAGIIEPVHVASGNQHADLGTKALADQPFNYHVPYLYGEVLPKS